VKEERLLDYIEGRLSARERAKIERHLSKCDRCLEEVMVAGEMVGERYLSKLESVPEHVTRKTVEKLLPQRTETVFEKASRFFRTFRIRGLVALHMMIPWGGKGLSPVRGTKTIIDENMILLKKSFADLDIEIEIDKVKPGNASIKVALEDDIQATKPVRVTLLKNGREVSSDLIRGTAVLFENVSFGRYTLAISTDGAEIGQFSFEIKETLNGKK